MWGQIALAAAPFVMSQLQDKPDRPAYNPNAAPLRDLSGYQNQILDMAFNQNSDTYRLAAEVAADNVNRMLARQGLAGSSPGAQLSANLQAKMAQDWVDQQLNRGLQGLDAVYNQDLQAKQYAMGNYDKDFQARMGDYTQRRLDQNSNIRGISDLISAGSNIYGQHQMNKRLDALMARQPMVGTPAPSYGPPSPPPMMDFNYSFDSMRSY